MMDRVRERARDSESTIESVRESERARQQVFPLRVGCYPCCTHI